MSDWFGTACVNWFLKPVGRALVRYLRAAALEKAVTVAKSSYYSTETNRIVTSLSEDEYR